MDVQVPAYARPGMTFSVIMPHSDEVNLPEGRAVQVTVPEGAAPGSIIEIAIVCDIPLTPEVSVGTWLATGRSLLCVCVFEW